MEKEPVTALKSMVHLEPTPNPKLKQLAMWFPEIEGPSFGRLHERSPTFSAPHALKLPGLDSTQKCSLCGALRNPVSTKKGPASMPESLSKRYFPALGRLNSCLKLAGGS